MVVTIAENLIFWFSNGLNQHKKHKKRVLSPFLDDFWPINQIFSNHNQNYWILNEKNYQIGLYFDHSEQNMNFKHKDVELNAHFIIGSIKNIMFTLILASLTLNFYNFVRFF